MGDLNADCPISMRAHLLRLASEYYWCINTSYSLVASVMRHAPAAGQAFTLGRIPARSPHVKWRGTVRRAGAP
jgi:hypothetical protein